MAKLKFLTEATPLSKEWAIEFNEARLAKRREEVEHIFKEREQEFKELVAEREQVAKVVAEYNKRLRKFEREVQEAASDIHKENRMYPTLYGFGDFQKGKQKEPTLEFYNNSYGSANDSVYYSILRNFNFKPKTKEKELVELKKEVFRCQEIHARKMEEDLSNYDGDAFDHLLGDYIY